MKRPIAMRCTHEQFESIKDKLIIPETINEPTKQYCWVVSERRVSEVGVQFYSNVDDYNEIHETFNADIFLESCGVEFEKVWKGSEMQIYLGNKWENCREDNKYRLKPQPNYDKEIEALQIKAKENGQSVTILFEKL